MVRRRYDGQVVEEQAKDVIATAYRHTTARGVSGAEAPDPQLHTHVVISGAVREDDRIVAVALPPGVPWAARGRRVLPLRARAGAGGGGLRDRAGHRQGRQVLRDRRGAARSCAMRSPSRHREIAHAAERFRAKHGRAPERGELRDIALENRRAKDLATRGDLQRVWARTGERHGFGADEAVHLVGSRRRRRSRRSRTASKRRLTERTAMFDAGLLRAVALEQSAGELSPEEAIGAARDDGQRATHPDLGGRADDDARRPGAGAGDRAPRRRARRRPADRMSASAREREQGGRGADRRTPLARAGARRSERDGPGAPRGPDRPSRNRQGRRDRRGRAGRAARSGGR